MYHVKILTVGKVREKWLNLALEEYEKRLTGQMRINWILFKKEDELFKAVDKEKIYHCFDPFGKSYTRENFSKFITQTQSHTFVIGGATALPESVRRGAQSLISLSPLTFTHLHTRLILLEQLYRSIEIHKGSEYHK